MSETGVNVVTSSTQDQPATMGPFGGPVLPALERFASMLENHGPEIASLLRVLLPLVLKGAGVAL